MTAADDLHLLALAVARIEGKLDGALAASTDHETRIRSLERWRWALTGAAAAAGAGSGAAVTSLLHH